MDVGYAIGDLFPVFYRRTGCLFTIGNEYEEYFSFSRKQEREHILEVNLTYPQLQGLETAYIARFGEIAGVTDVLPMDKDLFGGYFSTTTVRLGEGKYREFCEVRTGPNFASFFHIPVLAGEMFKYPGPKGG